jgi:hypothetical protein
MERSNRIAQVYGYTVCLVAIITFLISAAGIVNAAFNLSDPLRAEGFGGMSGNGSLTSFEAYKMNRKQQRPVILRTPNAPDAVSGSLNVPVADSSGTELHKMFDAERADQIGNVHFRAMRSLVTAFLMIIISSGLFLMHWRWLRREELKP